MKLYLSSEGVPRPDLLKELLEKSSTIPKVALINNAQDPYPVSVASERGIKLAELFHSLGFQTLDIDLREYRGKINELAEELKTCQLIWCSGGNAFWLRYVMKISGFDQIIKALLAEGIVYGGWSAGVVVTGPSLQPIELMDEPKKAPEIIWDGLGLVDFFVWPHWDKEKYLPLQKEASIRMKELPYKSVTLHDGEVLIVENDQVRLIK